MNGFLFLMTAILVLIFLNTLADLDAMAKTVIGAQNNSRRER